MIQNLHTFGSPILLLMSKVILTFTAFLLIAGRSTHAACLSPLALFFLHGATADSTTTKNLEKWIIISFVAAVSNFASWVSLTLASRLLEHDSLLRDESNNGNITSINIQAYKLWIFGAGVQKICALALLYHLYRDFKVAAPEEPEDAVHFLEVRISILKGRNLVAKDTNIFGRPTTSDPYVKVYHGPNKLGKTAIIKKTLDPEWQRHHNNTFRIPVVPRALDVYRNIECNIFDHDNLSSDDPMGTVYVRIPTHRNEKVVEWYRVEQGEGANFCKDAKGELLVEIEIRSQLNKSFKQQLFRQASQRTLNLKGLDTSSLPRRSTTTAPPPTAMFRPSIAFRETTPAPTPAPLSSSTKSLLSPSLASTADATPSSTTAQTQSLSSSERYVPPRGLARQPFRSHRNLDFQKTASTSSGSNKGGPFSSSRNILSRGARSTRKF